MFHVLQAAGKKLKRDRDLAWSALLRKSLRYAFELSIAPVYLMSVDKIGRGVRTLGRPRVENLGFMSIGEHTSIRSVNVAVELCTGPDGSLLIGRETNINYGVSIGATGRIEIGNRVRIGPYVMIVDTDFHDIYNRSLRPAPLPVVIEDDVWIGAKASIMPGVRIGRGSVVGTGAVVTRDVPAFTIVAGVPAKVIKNIDEQRFKPQGIA